MGIAVFVGNGLVIVVRTFYSHRTHKNALLLSYFTLTHLNIKNNVAGTKIKDVINIV